MIPTSSGTPAGDRYTVVAHTGGCNKLKEFATPGWRISLRTYSHQYQSRPDSGQAFIGVTYGLARDGSPVMPSGTALHAIRLAVLLSEHDDMLWLAGLSLWLQSLSVDLPAPLRRHLG